NKSFGGRRQAMRRRMNYSGNETYSCAESNDEENIEQEAPSGAEPTVIKDHGISAARSVGKGTGRTCGGNFRDVGIGRGEIFHYGSLKKFIGDSLVDVGKERMAAGRYGEGPGIVAMCTTV